MRKFKLKDKHSKENTQGEDLSKYKDFGKLMTNYEDTIDTVHRKPLYKSKKGIMILIILLLLLIAFLESQQRNRDVDDKGAPTEIDIDQ